MSSIVTSLDQGTPRVVSIAQLELTNNPVVEDKSKVAGVYKVITGVTCTGVMVTCCKFR